MCAVGAQAERFHVFTRFERGDLLRLDSEDGMAKPAMPKDFKSGRTYFGTQPRSSATIQAFPRGFHYNFEENLVLPFRSILRRRVYRRNAGETEAIYHQSFLSLLLQFSSVNSQLRFWNPSERIDAEKSENVIDAEIIENRGRFSNSLTPPLVVVCFMLFPGIERHSPVLSPLLCERVALKISFRRCSPDH